jgi:hypothetical protein
VKGGKSHSQSREGWHEGDTGKGNLLLKRLRLKCDGIEQEAREYSPRTVGKRLDIIKTCYFKIIMISNEIYRSGLATVATIVAIDFTDESG